MRRILVEAARRKNLPKYGGGRRRIELDEVHRVLASSDELLLLDDALDRLRAEDATAAEIVKLRLYAGLSVEEAADAMGLARATAYRHWTFARACSHEAQTGVLPIQRGAQLRSELMRSFAASISSVAFATAGMSERIASHTSRQAIST